MFVLYLFLIGPASFNLPSTINLFWSRARQQFLKDSPCN
ncbi:MAG: hypothetical protein AVDCRST_MAG95-119 [uncultured Adhaeribacter sp.]|uniref:Uncharacterized protein n=1 Tax=uncultured Adhaeribacter sp. TaxID=448109 RepID=A0A6J4H287_9BACT|nr:MAG: hypothetical protein AVDCRST_MAG95-119 [uncultured Adhaeribacter sp.]